MSFFSRRHGSFSERSSAFLFCVCVSACVRPDNNTAGRFFLGSHWLISVSGRWAFDRIVGSECPLSILSQRIDIFRLFFTALYDVIADVTTLFFTRLFFYFALSLSLFISLPFCFAVVVFFRVLLFAVRCFVVDFFWVVDDFTAWSTAAILCGVTLKLFFLGSCHLWSACFFLWPSASVHLLFTVQSKDQKLTTKNGQSKYRETRYTFHAFGFFILCFVLETSAHFKFSFQTIKKNW